VGDDGISYDEGTYFDTRPDSPPVWHYRVACEAGQLIPTEFRKHTFEVGERGQRRQCPECNEAETPPWTP
jgi:hypothetical protein